VWDRLHAIRVEAAASVLDRQSKLGRTPSVLESGTEIEGRRIVDFSDSSAIFILFQSWRQ
jgi:hypothetical protein